MPGKQLSQENSSKKKINYKDSGVDIDAGESLVEKIKPFAKKTSRPELLGSIGGFGSLFEIPKGYKQPVIVSGTDGVGTKLKLAIELNQHKTIGQDLVGMCVNDILVPTPSVPETITGCLYPLGISNKEPNPPIDPSNSGREVFFAKGLIFSTKLSPASISTPESL